MWKCEDSCLARFSYIMFINSLFPLRHKAHWHSRCRGGSTLYRYVCVYLYLCNNSNNNDYNSKGFSLYFFLIHIPSLLFFCRYDWSLATIDDVTTYSPLVQVYYTRKYKYLRWRCQNLFSDPRTVMIHALSLFSKSKK